LAVGQRPLIPWWGVPLRLASAVAVSAYVHAAYRIRSWGWLEAGRGPSLLISNHQVELDLMGPMATLTLHGGWHKPVITASAKLMYEPGFMAVRIPWLWRVMKNVNFGWLFEGMGMLPLENELQSRSIARWAWSAQRRHGVLPLAELFKPGVLEKTGFGACNTDDLFSGKHFKKAQDTYVRLSDLNVQYRKEAFDEMKAGVEADLERIEGALKKGATFYVTPEGEYTKTGAMLPFRGVWDRLLPYADHVFAAAISYDPFIGRRLSQLYRVLEVRGTQTAIAELKAARPVTTSALVAEWLTSRSGSFTEDEVASAMRARVVSLPHDLFLDPELARDPGGMARKAVRRLAQLGILRRSGDRFELSDRRTHPNFPGVEDIVVFQARFFGETLEGLQARASA
ncbi:MAG TPA: hypothetical protein VKT72_06790, partial [Candidatus Baltobacteraceae bacterium]|nr:hypothetical protein [Candidatus Baltobacteraceae bacterium]